MRTRRVSSCCRTARLVRPRAGIALTKRQSVDSIYEDISRAEQRQEALEQDLYRETLAWNRMKSQGNLLKTLRNNGIAMGGFRRPAGPADLHAPTAVAANF